MIVHWIQQTHGKSGPHDKWIPSVLPSDLMTLTYSIGPCETDHGEIGQAWRELCLGGHTKIPDASIDAKEGALETVRTKERDVVYAGGEDSTTNATQDSCEVD